MTRPLDSATSASLDNKIIPLAAIVYLDIENDPLFAWTGMGNLVFAAGQTGDSGLDGQTFIGTKQVIEISGVSEGVGGSDSLEISLPGVDINDLALKQLITDKRRWQFRRALVWLMTLDPTTYAIVGKPFRIKTGRIDGMPYKESRGQGVVSCIIEGQQAYGDQPLNTRYSEQIDININDTSQKWAYSLANMTPEMGKNSSAAFNMAVGVMSSSTSRTFGGGGSMSREGGRVEAF